MAQRRAAGRKTTFYVCCGPARPNTFTFSPPVESAWLGPLAASLHFDGFLRWAYNSWVEDPLTSTDFTSWPSGDCFLVYPGNRTSIRFERMREGFQDFEKIRILRSAGPAVSAAGGALVDLEAALSRFTPQRGVQGKEHAADVQVLRAALEKATRAVFPG